MQKSTKQPLDARRRVWAHPSPLSFNLLVRKLSRSIPFYENVLGAEVVYWDEDFAALKIGGVDSCSTPTTPTKTTRGSTPWLLG